MAKPKLSTKHVQIEKSNRVVLLATTIAAVVLIFGFVICRGLVQRQSHQTKVVQEKEKAVSMLKSNIEAKNKLVASYQAFITTERNVLGGSTAPEANGDKDGDNARLVLDALPSKYDYPALLTSVEKLLTGNGYVIVAIEGKDEEVNYADVEAQPNPELTEMPFAFTAESSYEGVQALVDVFEKSIRPFNVRALEMSASGSTIKFTVDMKTYYQPEKAISITEKVVR